MKSTKAITYLILFLVPFTVGILLNIYVFYSQFRGGFPMSWFFRYSTGEGYNTIILFIDWTALAIDLLAFFSVGFFCSIVYALVRARREA